MRFIKYLIITTGLLVGFGFLGSYELNNLDRIAMLEESQRIDSAIIVRLKQDYLEVKIEKDNYKRNLDEMNNAIEKIRSKGYKPDRLLIRYIQIKYEQVSVVPSDTIMKWIGIETSFKNRKGMLGEVGYTQILPETMTRELMKLGVPRWAIRIEDYAEMKTSMDWTYYFAFMLYQHTKKLTWKDWNSKAHGM